MLIGLPREGEDGKATTQRDISGCGGGGVCGDGRHKAGGGSPAEEDTAAVLRRACGDGRRDAGGGSPAEADMAAILRSACGDGHHEAGGGSPAEADTAAVRTVAAASLVEGWRAVGGGRCEAGGGGPAEAADPAAARMGGGGEGRRAVGGREP
ncbi:hypothetical protein BS78_01G204400 [Paspalum vaginatum]|nr:hypothetical protein BS78_01G204400 [Paspalum vaginatum]